MHKRMFFFLLLCSWITIMVNMIFPSSIPLPMLPSLAFSLFIHHCKPMCFALFSFLFFFMPPIHLRLTYEISLVCLIAIAISYRRIHCFRRQNNSFSFSVIVGVVDS
ncbi:hypothetical protein BT96DRAFT_613766 [Gymnopus androsaceus JB14]|uniref:Uncharacterized protein n=1 Tax=Gymnopus androsaceus JB14 TaxID=1447944 RepID=A0A6A4GIB3_9AGAR|nr:hypothetical protein BT96DRAFT_613766 [Gymnopus androsaceus JB14]